MATKITPQSAQGARQVDLQRSNSGGPASTLAREYGRTQRPRRETTREQQIARYKHTKAKASRRKSLIWMMCGRCDAWYNRYDKHRCNA